MGKLADRVAIRARQYAVFRQMDVNDGSVCMCRPAVVLVLLGRVKMEKWRSGECHQNRQRRLSRPGASHGPEIVSEFLRRVNRWNRIGASRPGNSSSRPTWRTYLRKESVELSSEPGLLTRPRSPGRCLISPTANLWVVLAASYARHSETDKLLDAAHADAQQGGRLPDGHRFRHASLLSMQSETKWKRNGEMLALTLVQASARRHPARGTLAVRTYCADTCPLMLPYAYRRAFVTGPCSPVLSK